MLFEPQLLFLIYNYLTKTRDCVFVTRDISAVKRFVYALKKIKKRKSDQNTYNFIFLYGI